MVNNNNNDFSVTYELPSGEPMTLSYSRIIKLLVSGKKELITVEEVVHFQQVCKARKMNPFLRHCYLVKYDRDTPAAIITSIDWLRQNAARHKSCAGWQSGIIVIDKDGKTKDTNGLILQGEVLVGGWFEATPKDWNTSLRREVNLSAHIQYKQNGNPTRFWSPQNAPMMIMKVAESQGLRALWGEHSSAMYIREEMPEHEPPMEIDAEYREIPEDNGKPEPEKNGTTEPDTFTAQAEKYLAGDEDRSARFNEFCKITAEGNDMTLEEFQGEAVGAFDQLTVAFEEWEQAKEPAN